MKDRIDIKSLALVAVILVVSGTVGCGTSRQTTSAKDTTVPAVGFSHQADTIHAPVLDATQSCRENLHRIEGAKSQWALENRKPNSEVPTDADLFGPNRFLPAKPKCPGGGRYTLRAVEDAPRCSIAGHVY